jgi:hypothetical protein
MRRPVVRLIGTPQAGGEYVALSDPGSDEEIVHLHDYERLYRIPGLYEHVVQELLACRSPEVAADALADALGALGRAPSEIVLLDLGAGTGIVGELARGIGISSIIGLDTLDAARAACLRDRPGVYRDYLVGDLAAPPPELLTMLERQGPNALISAGALGGTHASSAALVKALGLLPTGGPVVLTIDERWTRTGAPGGFRTLLARLMASGQLRLLRRSRFQHRLSTSGTPIQYELIVAVTGSPLEFDRQAGGPRATNRYSALSVSPRESRLTIGHAH